MAEDDQVELRALGEQLDGVSLEHARPLLCALEAAPLVRGARDAAGDPAGEVGVHPAHRVTDGPTA